VQEARSKARVHLQGLEVSVDCRPKWEGLAALVGAPAASEAFRSAHRAAVVETLVLAVWAVGRIPPKQSCKIATKMAIAKRPVSLFAASPRMERWGAARSSIYAYSPATGSNATTEQIVVKLIAV
jgi:hypothetical protein